MRFKIAVVLAGWFLLASAEPENGVKEKRGIFGDSGYSLGDYHNSIYNPLIDHEQQQLDHEYAPTYSHPYGQPITKQITIERKIPVPYPVPQPYRITIEKNVPVPVPHPVAVPVEKRIPVPVPYPVVKHVAVPVEKPVPVPVPQPYPVTLTIVKHVQIPTGHADISDHLGSSVNGQHSLSSLHHAISHTGLSAYSNFLYNGGFMQSQPYSQHPYLHHMFHPHHSSSPQSSLLYSPI